jgi:DNA-binding NtrC family response regulator
VLIVDDDEPVRHVHRRALTRAGVDVETTADGETALAAIQRTFFDVILSDIDMLASATR